jgi:hypothetical protein
MEARTIEELLTYVKLFYISSACLVLLCTTRGTSGWVVIGLRGKIEYECQSMCLEYRPLYSPSTEAARSCSDIAISSSEGVTDKQACRWQKVAAITAAG